MTKRKKGNVQQIPHLLDARKRTAIQYRLAREALRSGDPSLILKLQWPDLVLDEFQLDVIRSSFDATIREVFIKGCTGAGKGTAVALAVNLWFTLNEECKVIVTGPNVEHARKGIFGEIVTWRRRMQYPGDGRILANGLEASPQKYLKLANPITGEGFSGHHGPATLFVFDEATATSDQFFDLARTQSRLLIALANPRSYQGAFRRAFPANSPNTTQTIPAPLGQRRCITISGYDCRNVQEGRLVIPNQISRERLAAIMSHPDEHYRRVFGLAEFPAEDPVRQLILPSWLPRHVAVAEEEVEVTAFGLDVAVSETGDATILAAGGASGVRALHVLRCTSTSEIVGEVLRIASECYGVDLKRRVGITIDAIGVGKGVRDQLFEQGVRARAFCGAQAAENPSLYVNRRAEAYGELARRLDPKGQWAREPFRLPNDSLLLDELVAPERIPQSDGIRFRLTPKHRAGNESHSGETLVEKLGRSPDRADAVVYLYDQIRSEQADRPIVVSRPLIYNLNGAPFGVEEDDRQALQRQMRQWGNDEIDWPSSPRYAWLADFVSSGLERMFGG